MKRRPLRTRTSSFRSFSAKRSDRKATKKLLITIAIVGFLTYASFVWILPMMIGGLSLLNKFKDAPKPSTPISEDATLAPPVLNIPFESTNSAEIRIRGYSAPRSSIEIYLDEELKGTANVDENGSFVTDNIALSLGTNNIYGKTIDEKNHKSLGSKPIRIIYNNEKPKLDLSSPQDNQVITGGDKKVTVSGTTDQLNNLVATVNGARVIIDADGRFSQTININEGENTITVNITDQAGNSTQLARKVTYQP